MSVVFIDLNNGEGGTKMSTCRFRSNQKVSKDIASCCGNTKAVTAYQCPKRDIFPLTDGICDVCTVYEPKP